VVPQIALGTREALAPGTPPPWGLRETASRRSGSCLRSTRERAPAKVGTASTKTRNVTSRLRERRHATRTVSSGSRHWFALDLSARAAFRLSSAPATEQARVSTDREKGSWSLGYRRPVLRAQASTSARRQIRPDASSATGAEKSECIATTARTATPRPHRPAR
jgi:hypothetical protein